MLKIPAIQNLVPRVLAARTLKAERGETKRRQIDVSLAQTAVLTSLQVSKLTLAGI